MDGVDKLNEVAKMLGPGVKNEDLSPEDRQIAEELDRILTIFPT